jgi:hypothetical protein
MDVQSTDQIKRIPWILGIHGIHEICGIRGIHGIHRIFGICRIHGIQEFQNYCNSRISPNFRHLVNKVLEFGEKNPEKLGIPRISQKKQFHQYFLLQKLVDV